MQTLALFIALLLAQAEAGFARGPMRPKVPSTTSPHKPNHALHTIKMPDVVNTLALPAAAYAGLGGTTLAAFKLLGGTTAAASAGPLGLLGLSIGIPVALTTTVVALQGGPGVAKRMGGTPADTRLVKLANDAAEAVGVRPPKYVFEIPASEPNAFAASGFGSSSSTVAVTTGLRNLLTQTELAAVLAHEMGHLRHRDVARNMHVAIASAGLGGIYEAGRLLVDSSRRSKSRTKSDKKSEDSSAGVGLALMGVGMVSQGVAHLVQLGASRGAELRADLAAAEAYGAEPLISALRKIDQGAARQPADLRSSSAGKQMAFAMISDGPSAQPAVPTGGHAAAKPGWRRAIEGIGRALRTHPPLETRIGSLEEAMASGRVRAR